MVDTTGTTMNDWTYGPAGSYDDDNNNAPDQPAFVMTSTSKKEHTTCY